MAEPLANFLRQTKIFADLSNSQLQHLGAIAQPRFYEKGETIFQQGDPPTGFFIVRTGMVKVFKIAQDGREHILHLFEGTEHFAEIPALDGQAYPASATAIEPTSIVFFPRSSFLELLEQQPNLAINLLKGFASHVRYLSTIVDNLTLREVPARLAHYLLEENQQNIGNPTITLRVTKGQLAAKLGTVPETLSRAFAKLKQQQLLRVQGNQIELLDIKSLETMVNSSKD